MTTQNLFVQRECHFSPDRHYRYSLKIVWDDSKPIQVFAGLNPSRADEVIDDNTVRRWIAFAKDWGCGGGLILNAFAWRSTDWTVLLNVTDPVGEENNQIILDAFKAATQPPIVCWGANASKIDCNREQAICEMAGIAGVELYCLGTNADGSPCHPLYLRGDTKPRPWRIAA